MGSGPNVPINSATRPIGVGFVADVVRAPPFGESPRIVPLNATQVTGGSPAPS